MATKMKYPMKCPKCGSTKVELVSSIEDIDITETWKCKVCGNYWLNVIEV